MVEPLLWVHARVAERLATVLPRPWEIGGWLLGYRAEEELVVTHATPPRSRGTPWGVTINGRGHQRLFDAAWDASQGRVTFLGDWHTHPGGPPHPSDRDRNAASLLATDPDFRTPRPMMAIVATRRWPGREGRQGEIGWFLREGTGDLRSLNAQPFAELPPYAAAVPDWPWR